MDKLEQWFKSNGGYLHPNVHLATSITQGSHFRTNAALDTNTPILTVPHSLSLSNLNAQVDDALPVFKKHAGVFTVEALSFFYLMSQWICGEMSFWKPYLDTLPRPEEGFGTPFWFDETDLLWLEGTDVLPSFLARRDIWKNYWKEGVQVLEQAGMATEPYTWELFKWAATVYTSRSFNSLTVRPQDSKYWTTYKQGSNGTRQTVLLDLTHVAAERKDFSVLFPVMDAGNHQPAAKVSWSYDPGRFSLTLQENIAADAQLFNNYGPKSNDELLMGYGFCVTDNPHDCVRLAMRPPPEPLQQMLRVSHPGYFKAGTREWNTDAATFNIVSKSTSDSSDIWHCIPAPLCELFYYIVRLERGLDVLPISDADAYLFHGQGRRYLPRIAFYIYSSLAPKLARLAQATAALPPLPQNQRQQNAATYRSGQQNIMQQTQAGMSAYLQSLRAHALDSSPSLATDAAEASVPHRSAIWTIEEVLDVCKTDAPDLHKAFTAGIKYCFGTSKLRKLRGTEQEEQVWALWLCAARLWYEASRMELQRGLVGAWMDSLLAEYGEVDGDGDAGDGGDEGEEEEPLMAGVRKSAMFLPGSVWTSPTWSSNLILSWGARIAQCQGTAMQVDEDDVRHVVYLHMDETVRMEAE